MGYLGGTYSIPKEFRKSKVEWVLDLKNNEVVSAIFELSKFKEVVEDGFEYVKNISIYFAPTPSDKTAIIERNLLYAIKPTRTSWGTKSKPEIEIEFSHTGALSNVEIQQLKNR